MTQKSSTILFPQHMNAPGPHGHFLFGSARDIQRDPPDFGLTISRQYGDVVRIRLFIWPAYLVNHPDGIKHVLQENQQNYNKDLYPYKILKPLLGRGLVTNDGKSWLHQWRLMQPAFHRKGLDAFGSLMTGATITMLDQWENVAERDQPLDVAAEMQRLPLCIAELDMVLNGHLPTMEHLARLPYTRMVLDETLRLYPPAWVFGRKTIADDEIGGYFIPANSMIVLSPYFTHRHPAFWQDPEMFDPGRFTPERIASRPHFAYFPFGGGSRLCIGNNFALMEVQLILATIAQCYTFHLVPGYTVESEALLSLRPRCGLPMMLHHR